MAKCWHCDIYDAHSSIGLCIKCDSVSESMLMTHQTKQRLEYLQSMLERQQHIIDAAEAATDKDAWIAIIKSVMIAK